MTILSAAAKKITEERENHALSSRHSNRSPSSSHKRNQNNTKTVTEDGCNSEDEYNAGDNNGDTSSIIAEGNRIEGIAQQVAHENGYEIVLMEPDGACLFRAVAHQIFGEQSFHDVVRKQVCDHMEAHTNHYKEFLTEDFIAYITRKRLADCHGNNLEIQAVAELYNRPVKVFEYEIIARRYQLDPINTFQIEQISKSSTEVTDIQPICLIYHRQLQHYNALIDEHSAAVGVGLGMPHLQTTSTRQDFKYAKSVSEASALEQQMLDDKMAQTDWIETQRLLEEEALRASYTTWQQEQHNFSNEPSSSCSQVKSLKKSRQPSPTTVSDDNEDALLKKVLQESQLAFYESCKKAKHNNNDCDNDCD